MLAYKLIKWLNNLDLLMKQIDFISSENVVNIASPEKMNIIGEHSYCYKGSVLLIAIDKINRFTSKKK
ncbi:MAG: hypothetical protein ACYC0A_07695 [Lutibacter sp.]